MRLFPLVIRHWPSAIVHRISRILTLLVLLWLTALPVEAQEEGLKLGGLVTTGSLEFGLRQALVGGNQDVYRSHVNLGSGIRLFDVSLQSRSPDNVGPIYDFLSYSMSSWGGDPYNTVRLRLERYHRYRFDFHYWRMDYVNLLPTFANPLLDQGVLINQHSFNHSRRLSQVGFTIWPDTSFQVRVTYDRTYAFGQALTTFSIGLDEFVLNDPIRTTTNDYAVGVDVRLGRVDVTVEQDFRTCKDDIATFQPEGLVNTGNNPRPGPVGARIPQQILLTSFTRNSGVRGFIPATRLGLNARLSGQLHITGRAVYSDADVDFNRDEILSGMLFDLTALSFLTRQSSRTLANVSRPTTTADASVNYRPTSRLSLTNSTSLNHFVIAGGSLLETLQILGLDFQGNPPPPDQMQRLISSFLDERTSLTSLRNLVEASYDLLSSLTLRAGYRFTHRRARLNIPAPFRSMEDSTLDTHTGIAGLSMRVTTKLRLLTEVERGSANNVFTRVAPYHVTRFRLRSSAQPWKTVRLNGQYLLTDARNPNPFVDNLQRHRSFNIHASWFPNQRWNLDMGYTRADISSLTTIINPRTLQSGQSVYIADDNVVDADLTVSPIKAAQISIGYSLINSQGTFPLNYYQPRARISYDIHRRLSWIAAWGWYGYNEKGVALQDYRAHRLTTSLRITF